MKIDLYWDIGIDRHQKPNPTTEEIYASWKKYAAKYHFDRFISRPASEQQNAKKRCDRISLAKSVLLDDPERRQAYDKKHIISEAAFQNWKANNSALAP